MKDLWNKVPEGARVFVIFCVAVLVLEAIQYVTG